MEQRSTTIEFKTLSSYNDIEDLSQECTAYMKTKQFMAKRIHQQQEEIEMLRQNVLYHSAKHIQMYEMFKNMTDQLKMIKENLGNKKVIENENKEKDNKDNINLF